jgi:hypothetical protein
MRSLKVIYDGPLDHELDLAIEDAIRPLGWKWWASGYEFETDKRDLAFDLKEEENGD